MPQHVEKLAVLFADICGSTALYENFGDDFARKIISRCIDTMTGKISAYQGKLIKTIGNEIMVTFPSAEAALHAACAMQLAVVNERPSDGVPLQIRIGFNYGEVVKESDDVFGNTVNVAARVAAITRAGQVLATQAVVNALPPNLQNRLRQIMRAEFKGKQEHQRFTRLSASRKTPRIPVSGCRYIASLRTITPRCCCIIATSRSRSTRNAGVWHWDGESLATSS